MHGPSTLDKVKDAIRANSLDDLKALDLRNANLKDDQGATCVHYVCRAGKVQLLIYLIKDVGLPANTRTDIGATPAHDAAATGHFEAVRWLLTNTPCKVSKCAESCGPRCVLYCIPVQICIVELRNKVSLRVSYFYFIYQC